MDDSLVSKTATREQKTLVQISTSSFKGCDNRDNCNPNNQHYLKIVNHHGMTVKLWECRICGSEFRHQYMLRRHLPGHTDERNYHCNICGKSFRQLSTLTQHKAIHSQARPHTCMTCKKTFNRISTLISHRKTHTDEKPFKCTMCNKGFHQKGNLRNHLYSHTNERPYRCGLCNKGFNQQSNLTCHLKKLHGFMGKVNQNVKPKWEKPFVPQTADSALNYVNASSTVTVDQIKTPEIQEILQHNQVPFALLKHENNRPVLVRIYPSSTSDGKHMLVPITSTDLMSRGELVIGKQENDGSKAVFETNDPLLHLHIPLAAILESKISQDGVHTITVYSPSNYSNNNLSDNVLGAIELEKCEKDDSYIVPDFCNVKNEMGGYGEQGMKVSAQNGNNKLVCGSVSRLVPFSEDPLTPSSTRDPIMNHPQDSHSNQHAYLQENTPIQRTGDINNSVLNVFTPTNNLLDFQGLPSFSGDYNDVQLFDNLDCMDSFCKKV